MLQFTEARPSSREDLALYLAQGRNFKGGKSLSMLFSWKLDRQKGNTPGVLSTLMFTVFYFCHPEGHLKAETGIQRTSEII